MTTGAVGIEVELLFLDSVFHITSGAIDFVVQILSTCRQTGDDIARIFAFGTVLDFGDDTPFPIPGPCTVIELSKPAHLATILVVALPGLMDRFSATPLQRLVFGNTNDIVDLIAFAPGEHLPAAKAGITPEDDLDLWPGLTKAFDQQG